MRPDCMDLVETLHAHVAWVLVRELTLILNWACACASARTHSLALQIIIGPLFGEGLLHV